MSKTFSEIVDEVAKTAGLNSNIPAVVGYVNRAIKVLTPIRHFSDMVELQHRVPSFTKKLVLDLPQNHRVTRAIRVDNRTFAKRKLPGLVQAVTTDTSHYYYESGTKLVIVGAIRSHVDIAYYRVTPAFKYYPQEYRMLRSSEKEGESMYEYREPETNEWLALNLHDPAHESSYLRHTNWITKGYSEVLTNGALSHAYNSKGETERGSRLFQLFTQDVRDIRKSHHDLTVGEY